MFGIHRFYRLHRLRRKVYAKRMNGAEVFKFSPVTQNSPFDVHITASRHGKVLHFDPKLLGSFGESYRNYLRPILATFARINSTDFETHVSMLDGFVKGSATDCLYFSDTREQVPLLIDPFFYHMEGYAKFTKIELPKWHERKTTVLWRGATTGAAALNTTNEMCVTDDRLRQRIRLAMLAKQHTHCDIKIHHVVQTVDEALDTTRLKDHELLGERINEMEMSNSQFGLDIDGNTNSWSQFLKLAKLGCCIFKVESPRGHKQWYTDEFEAMQHYIPIRADLADFDERVDWAFSNPNACELIAREANRIAMQMTLDRELNKTALAIQATL